MRITLTILFYFFATGISLAQSTCGTCDLPESLEEDAKSLRNDFEKLSYQELLNQQILETLCENNSCGNLTETQASRLLDRSIAHEKAENEAWDRWEAKWTTRAGVLFTLFGLLLALLAYLQSRSAEKRSVRNQVEIEHLTKARE